MLHAGTAAGERPKRWWESAHHWPWSIILKHTSTIINHIHNHIGPPIYHPLFCINHCIATIYKPCTNHHYLLLHHWLLASTNGFNEWAHPSTTYPTKNRVTCARTKRTLTSRDWPVSSCCPGARVAAATTEPVGSWFSGRVLVDLRACGCGCWQMNCTGWLPLFVHTALANLPALARSIHG